MRESFSGVSHKRRCGNDKSEPLLSCYVWGVWLVTGGLRVWPLAGRCRSRGRRTLRGGCRAFYCRRQLNGLAHAVVSDNQRLQRVSPPCNHIASRNVSHKLRSFTGIDNHVTRGLIDRLIVRPLGKFFTTYISKDEVIFAAIVE